MKHNLRANEQYLRDLALWLDRQTHVTFLGTSRLTWDAQDKLMYDQSTGNHVLQLGWD